MTVTIYNNKSEKNVVNKNISAIGTFSCRPSESVDILNPVIILDVNSLDKTKANYCYIPDLKRYYYIMSCNLESGNRVVLRCAFDSLMSWRLELLNNKGTIDRNEKLYNGYIVDNRYKSLAYKNIVTKKFPNGMTADSIILMTVGG